MDLLKLLESIIEAPEAHAKWLNTLSMMENVGARKIARFEDAVTVNTSILKHASEEARHAYILKRMIPKTGVPGYDTYENQFLFVPQTSRHYLHSLDVFAARYLKEKLGLEGYDLRYMAYLLVTYAIEMRADELYPIYEQALKNKRTKYISVRQIIVEEEGHLEEMINQLRSGLPDWEEYAQIMTDYETKLYSNWLKEVSNELLMKEKEVA